MPIEPERPDFDRLPPGTKQLFEERLDRLPIEHLHSRIDADAMMLNEARFRDQFLAADSPTGVDALATWHLRATYDRLSGARPDLVPPRPAEGGPLIGHRTVALGRYRRLRRRLRPNFLVGWPTWFRNRWASFRAIRVRFRARTLRRYE